MITLWEQLVSSFRFTRQNLRLILIIYLFQLFLSLTIGIQVYHIIERSMSNSLALKQMISGFDFTIISDLLNNHGASLSPMIGQIRWHLLFYLICSVFINGGLIYLAICSKKGLKDFFEGGLRYFIPFLKIALVSYFMILLLTILIWIPFFGGFFYFVEQLKRESPIIWAIPILLFLYGAGISLIFLASFIARGYLIVGEMKVRRALRKAIEKLFKHYIQLLSRLLVVFVIFLLLIGLHYSASLTLGIRSVGLIFFFLLIQQSIAFSRVGLRLLKYRMLYLQAIRIDPSLVNHVNSAIEHDQPVQE